HTRWPRDWSSDVCSSDLSTSRPLVVAKDVKKSFQHMGRTLEVLRGIDLTIDEGDMIGIVGQSGAGKSTLLHCIGTLDIVTSGSRSEERRVGKGCRRWGAA